MAQVCEITGKRPQRGHNVSHANNKTAAKWHLNLRHKKYFIPTLSRSVTLRLTTRAIRTIDKHGDLAMALLRIDDKLFSTRVKQLKHQIISFQQKKRKKA